MTEPLKLMVEYRPDAPRTIAYSVVSDDYDGAPDAGRQPHGLGATEAEAVIDFFDSADLPYHTLWVKV